MTQFYTYLHCRPNGDPFYVGKGQGKRCYAFRRNRNLHYLRVVDKYGARNIQVFVFPCETEEEAFEDEIQQIAQLRAEGHALVNISSGGEGKSGVIPSAETRAKISAAGKGNQYAKGGKGRAGIPLTPEQRAHLSVVKMGHKRSAESRAKQSASNKGRQPFLGGIHSEEAKAKISASLRANKQRNVKHQKYAYHGEMLSRRDIEERYGVDRETFRARVRIGWSVEAAIEAPQTAPATYEVAGKMCTMQELEKLAGRNKTTLRRWMLAGVTAEEAIARALR